MACSGVNEAGWGRREAERRDRHNRSPFRMELWSWGGLQACLDSDKAASGRAPDLGHGSEGVEDSFHSGLGCELSAASTPGSWRMERLGPRGGIWVGTTLSSKPALLNASPMKSVTSTWQRKVFSVEQQNFVHGQELADSPHYLSSFA